MGLVLPLSLWKHTFYLHLILFLLSFLTLCTKGPMLSDLIDLDELLENTKFEIGDTEPFHPYEQLMACLPPSSSYLLPKPYQWLMNSSQSPIIDFYPRSNSVTWTGIPLVILYLLSVTHKADKHESLVVAEKIVNWWKTESRQPSVVFIHFNGG